MGSPSPLPVLLASAEMERRLAAHLHGYNHRRAHHALGGLLAPADRYSGRTSEVLAGIEASAADDSNDVLSMRDWVPDVYFAPPMVMTILPRARPFSI